MEELHFEEDIVAEIVKVVLSLVALDLDIIVEEDIVAEEDKVVVGNIAVQEDIVEEFVEEDKVVEEDIVEEFVEEDIVVEFVEENKAVVLDFVVEEEIVAGVDIVVVVNIAVEKNFLELQLLP